VKPTIDFLHESQCDLLKRGGKGAEHVGAFAHPGVLPWKGVRWTGGTVAACDEQGEESPGFTGHGDG